MAKKSRTTEHSFRDPVHSETALRRVLAVLGPYREDLILIGGWVPYLYQRFGGFPGWRAEIARTVELDLIVPNSLDRAQRRPLAEILGKAGFTCTPGGSGAYWIREGAADEIIEFFTVHRGTARQIGNPRQISGQTDLAAISLTHLTLLTDETRSLAIGGTKENEITVRVPTLGGYVLNKALTFLERLSASDEGVSKAGKDIVYVRDVMAGGEEVRSQLRSDMKLLAGRMQPRNGQIRAAQNSLSQLTAGPSRVLDAAVSQVALQHRFSSDDLARADILGYLEILSGLLSDIQPKRGRRAGG